VKFADETAARLVAAAGVGAADPDEKAFAWGDVDHDGDVDLVVARKQPFTTTGKRRNVLLLNESGVLVDRTAQYAAQSDVPLDLGFLTPTNDRDILLADLDRDGWLDAVTAATESDGDPQHIAYPRVYVNRGEDAGGWRGFRHEAARIPPMLSGTVSPASTRASTTSLRVTSTATTFPTCTSATTTRQAAIRRVATSTTSCC
jgi:hypothetical protein